ncbi:hypothetical protein HHI36_004922, partial [Cryptolaemus montrouzieri]
MKEMTIAQHTRREALLGVRNESRLFSCNRDVFDVVMASATGFCFLLIVCTAARVQAVTKLPNTTGIDGQLTAELEIDKFFSYWVVFNNDDDVKMSGYFKAERKVGIEEAELFKFSIESHYLEYERSLKKKLILIV